MNSCSLNSTQKDDRNLLGEWEGPESVLPAVENHGYV